MTYNYFIIIPSKSAEPSKINLKWLGKKLKNFPLNGQKEKENVFFLFFFSISAKNISSHRLKYIWYSPQKCKYPLYILF